MQPQDLRVDLFPKALAQVPQEPPKGPYTLYLSNTTDVPIYVKFSPEPGGGILLPIGKCFKKNCKKGEVVYTYQTDGLKVVNYSVVDTEEQGGGAGT